MGFNLTDKSCKFLSFVAIILFVFFFGGRGFIGWDWTNYYQDFKEATTIRQVFSHDHMFNEPAWNIYVALIKTFTNNYSVFVFISTLIDAVLLHLFFDKHIEHKYYAMALAVFLVFYGFTFETDLMRNVKGLLIVLVGLRYIETREWWKFFLLGIIGTLFHWSIAMILPCYFFLHRRISLKWTLIFFVIGNIIYLAGLPSVSLVIRGIAQLMPTDQKETVLFYVTNAIYSKTYGLTLGYIERTLVFLLVLFYQHKMIEDNKGNTMFINAMMLFVMICLYGYEFNIIITRVGALFSFGCWIMYPLLLKYLDKPLKPVYWIVISAIILIKINTLSNNVLYDYQNCFIENIDNYDTRKDIFEKHYKQLQR